MKRVKHTELDDVGCLHHSMCSVAVVTNSFIILATVIFTRTTLRNTMSRTPGIEQRQPWMGMCSEVSSPRLPGAPGSLTTSEESAGAIHIWACSDSCGISSSPLLLAIPLLPRVSLLRWEHVEGKIHSFSSLASWVVNVLRSHRKIHVRYFVA